ncbi:MAG: hypothetical protein CFH10_00039 [Alphaproteobacteria bacterium MarineAlpha4_Bin2]|nr:MAG: hypothetical protein CFH10_00039 [Alphaproteobacteria bacterium MarineAlpha4_Bin2]
MTVQFLTRLTGPFVLGLCILVGLYYAIEDTNKNLGEPAIISGWVLFGFLLLLVALNLRKKLIAFNIGAVRHWVAFHIVGGLISVIIFLVHTKGVIFPLGLYEQIIAFLFWIVSITGVIGTLIINVYPRRLTDAGGEISFDTIPSELVALRVEAETCVIDCVNSSGEATLSEHYSETLDWFFRRPRFYFNHLLGGDRSSAWVNRHVEEVRRYLNDKEQEFLNQILHLATEKSILDRQFSCQDLMRKWLLLHVPLSVALIATSGWHIIMIHMYSQ